MRKYERDEENWVFGGPVTGDERPDITPERDAVVAEIEAAIESASSRIHNSTDWSDPHYAINGKTIYECERLATRERDSQRMFLKAVQDSAEKASAAFREQGQMTAEEADAAYDAAPAEPLSDEEIERLVKVATEAKKS